MMRKNIARIAIIVALILLVPLVLTMLNPNAHLNGGAGGGWDWMPGDFLVMGLLMFGVGYAVDLVLRKFADPMRKTIAIVAIIITFLLIWVELAVDGVSRMLGWL